MTATYLNFDLLIDRSLQAQRYRARVLQSPAGEDSGDFSLPFRPDELADFLWRTAGGTRHLGAAPEEAESALDARAFGSRLYQAALAGPVGNLLRRSLDEAERRGAGLRIRLRLDRAALDLAELPWEFLFAPDLDRFLVLSDQTPIVRYIELDRPVQPLAARLPLTVLAVVANPSDVPPLAVEREWQNLQAALDPLVQYGVIALERLEAATLPALQARLRRGGSAPVHLLHFVGHGTFDAEANTGGLVFEDERGRAALATAETLGMLLHDHAALRLIFLNACEAAQSGRRDPFAGVAQRLVQQGAPAVLAMQFRVTDAAAIALSQTFYQALADGLPADTALSQARKAIAAAGNPWEWATPVLFSRAEDNRLFDLRDALPAPPCPYPGMVPFREADARFFYGREGEIQQMLDHLRHQRFLLVIGPSGSGKSSLIAAGLLPRLEKSTYFPPGFWLVRAMRPLDHPLSALAACLEGDVGQPEQAVAALLAAHAPAQRLLLVIDQFEETFSLADKAERQQFMAALQALRRSPQCALVLALRADFYPDLMNSDLWPVDPGQRLEVAILRGDALRRAIRQPAADVEVDIDDALIERLVADLAGEPGALPMLQETLVLLWERMRRRQITLGDYEQLGEGERSGLAVAVARKADATVAELAPAEQVIAQRIFLRLIQFGEGRRDTRRQLPVADLRNVADDDQAFERTLEHLARNRLLTTSGEERGARRVDIAHEALITGWPRLQEWVSQRRAAEQTRRRLEGKASEWVQTGQRGGLLDEYELQEAEHWLASEDAEELGYSQVLVDLVQASNRAIAQAKAEKEAQTQRLIEEQRLRAEEGEQAARGLRKRLVAATAAVVIAVIALVVAVAFGAESSRQRNRAESALTTAEAERAAAQLQAAIAQIGELAAESKSVVVDAPQLGLLLAAEAVNKSLSLGEEYGSVKAEQVLLDALTMAGGTSLAAPGSQIYGLVFSEDGRWLAAQSTWDAPTRLWDMNADGTGRPRQRWIATVDLLPDDPDMLLAGSPSPPGSSAVPSMPPANPDKFPSVSPPLVLDSNVPSFAPVDPGGSTGAPAPLTAKDASVSLTHVDDPNVGYPAEFSPDGRWVAVYHIGDDRVRLWSLGKGLAEPASTILDGVASEGAFSPDSCQLATGDLLGVIRVWDVCESYPPAEPLTWAGHAITVTAVAYSPDSRWLATAAGSDVVKLWDMKQAQPFVSPRVLDNNVFVDQLEWSADGRWLLASANGRHLRVWRITDVAREQANVASEPMLQQGASRFALSRSGGWLVMVENHGASSATPERFDVTFFKLQPESPQPDLVSTCSFFGTAESVTISQDGHWIAVTIDDDDILLLDPNSANLCTGPTLKAPRGVLVETLFSPDSRWLAARTEYQQIAHLWQLPLVVDQAEPIVLYGHDASISAAAFSADNRWLATGGIDGEIRLWDLASATIGAALPVTFHKGYDPCNAGCKIVATPDSKWIATPYVRGDSEGIAFWEIGLQARAEPSFLCRSERGYWSVWDVLDMAYNAEARMLAIMHDNGVDLFDVDFLSQTCAPKMAGEQNRPWPDLTATGFSRDGRWLILQNVEGQSFQLWDMTGDLNARTIPCRASFPPDGASLTGQVLLRGHLIAWGSDGSGATWCRDRLLEDTAVESVSSANQQWGAINRGDDPVSETNIWNLDLTEPQVIRSLSGSGSTGRVLAIENSGRWFAQNDGTGFSVFRLDTGAIEMPPLVSQPEPTSDAAFSEDGRWFAAVSEDGVIRVWNTAQLAPRGLLLFHLDPDETQTGRWAGASVSFSPDSQWLIGFSTTVVKMWPLSAQTWINQACQVAARPMTSNEMWLHRGDMSDPQLCLK